MERVWHPLAGCASSPYSQLCTAKDSRALGSAAHNKAHTLSHSWIPEHRTSTSKYSNKDSSQVCIFMKTLPYCFSAARDSFFLQYTHRCTYTHRVLGSPEQFTQLRICSSHFARLCLKNSILQIGAWKIHAKNINFHTRVPLHALPHHPYTIYYFFGEAMYSEIRVHLNYTCH